MRSPRLIALAAMALITLLAVGWISDHSTRVMARSVTSLDHTRDVLASMDQLRAAIAETESSARGYVITDDAAFKIAVDRSVTTVRASLSELKQHAGHISPQRTSLGALDALVARRLELLNRLLVLEQRHVTREDLRRNVVQATIVSGEINKVLADIRTVELSHFRSQVTEAEKAYQYAVYGPWILCFIAAFLFAWMVTQMSVTLEQGRLARQRAQEADQLKNQFLATVSHELRTPLTSIIGWCGLLGETESRETLLDEGLMSIAQAAHVQSQLIEDLLDVSRIIAGKLKLHLSEVDAARVVDKAIASVAPSARAKGITLKTSFESDLTFIADPIRVEQIVWNLLSNAVKFTPPDGAIEVAVRRANGSVEISVRDNGVGIPPDLLPHVFERFKQGEATGARADGLGLGLAIVSTLVELHGGSVRAESAGAGMGATFTVKLPIGGPLSSRAIGT